jgi:hypothetical protein
VQARTLFLNPIQPHRLESDDLPQALQARTYLVHVRGGALQVPHGHPTRKEKFQRSLARPGWESIHPAVANRLPYHALQPRRNGTRSQGGAPRDARGRKTNQCQHLALAGGGAGLDGLCDRAPRDEASRACIIAGGGVSAKGPIQGRRVSRLRTTEDQRPFVDELGAGDTQVHAAYTRRSQRRSRACTQ